MHTGVCCRIIYSSKSLETISMFDIGEMAK